MFNLNVFNVLGLFKVSNMDWMYDGTRIQKDDYLLGKKIDKKYGESTENGNCQ